MSENYEYGFEYFKYQSTRSSFRTFVRQFYLRKVARCCLGPTLDVGSGVGDLLPHLPQRSIGVEINAFSVEHGRSLGRNLALVPRGGPLSETIGPHLISDITSITCMHVLEHLDDPAAFFLELASLGMSRSVRRFVFVVPGLKGFQSDATHRVMIDKAFFRGVCATSGLLIKSMEYFPLPLEWACRFLTHNELQVVLDAPGGT
jgi:SAM-dependent methyltransferase